MIIVANRIATIDRLNIEVALKEIKKLILAFPKMKNIHLILPANPRHRRRTRRRIIRSSELLVDPLFVVSNLGKNGGRIVRTAPKTKRGNTGQFTTTVQSTTTVWHAQSLVLSGSSGADHRALNHSVEHLIARSPRVDCNQKALEPRRGNPGLPVPPGDVACVIFRNNSVV